MAFEFNQTSLSKQQDEMVCEFAVSGKFEEVDQKEIRSVLKVNCHSQINGSEFLSTGANISGQTNVSLCVLSEENEFKTIKGTIDWQNKCEISDASLKNVVATTKNIEVKTSGDMVFVSAVVEIKACGLKETNISSLIESDVVLAKKESKQVTSACAFSVEKFNIVEDVALDDDNISILSVCPSVNVLEVRAQANTAVISGNVYLELLEEKDGGVANSFKTIEFKEEVKLDGASEDGVAFSNVVVENCDYIVSDSDNKKQLEVTINLLSENVCYKKEDVEITTDAYCLDKTTTLATSCEEFDYYAELRQEQKQVVFNLDLDSLVGYDEFVSGQAFGAPTWASTFSDGETSVSGETNVSLVYKNEEGQMLQKNTVVPFEMSLGEGTICVTNVALKNIAVKVRGAHEVNIELNLETTYLTKESDYLEFVSGLEDCGEAEEDDSAIVMAIAEENDDSFSMGKKLRVSPEDIASQNETANLNAGDKIFVYKHKEENFNY